MKTNTKLAVLLFVLLIVGTAAQGAEYFTNKRGADANDGATRLTAFLTIQKGLSALKPGDTLTIGPGEYFESVQLADFGSADVDTLIRAEIPGTVLLRGDMDAPAFQKVEGRRFVYVAEFDQKVLSAYETDTMTRLLPSPEMDSLEFRPGSWYHDQVNNRLYISSSDFASPDRHHYTVGLLRDNGFRVWNSQRVVIDGLAASGYMTPLKDPVWSLPVSGFLLHHSKNSTIRRCSAFFNETGICIRNDGGDENGLSSLIEDCRAYGNLIDGIVSFFPNRDAFRGCTSFLNGGCGIQFYGDRTGDVVFSDCLSWGNSYGDFRMKGKGLSGEDKFAVAERCISLERFDVYNITHCIIGGPNYYRGDTPPDNIVMPNDAAFKDREFADAINFDFRLQSTSPFRQAGEGYQYKGPYPFEANIYYVKSDGNDEFDGLSMRTAWNSLNHAYKNLKAGDTLYLSAGRYTSDSPLTLKQVNVRGRGRDTVVIAGRFDLANSEGVRFERLQFAEQVHVEKSSQIAFDNCIFPANKPLEVMGAKGFKATHNVFGASVKLTGSTGVFLSGNVFAASPAVQADALDSVIYSSYNSYPSADKCWEVAGKLFSFAELQEKLDAYSQLLPPELSLNDGLISVANANQFVGKGPLGSAIGNYQEWELRYLQFVGPFVYSVTDTTANIEWWTSLPSTVELCWGDTPECVNKITINQTSFHTHSLIGLEPGKKYCAKVRPVQLQALADPGRRFRMQEQDYAAVEFTTEQKGDALPRTYYVALDGNNDNDGLTRQTAWKSIQYAADRVRPGDTVLIGGGKYPGTVYFRVSGSPNKPITFKAIPGEKVVIEGMRETLKNGLVLYEKHYYDFDSLYVHGYAGGDGSGAVLIDGGSNVQLTRSQFGMGWGTGISAARCSNISIKNCVFTHGMGMATFSRCPNLNIENNVFIASLISNLTIGNASNEPARVTNNIFGENTRGKQQQCFVSLSENTVESNNCFYLRWPESERMVMNYMPMPEYKAVTGTDSFVANPQMPGALGFRQGWQQISSFEFTSLFAANPEVVKRGIGLQPEVFSDFHFKMPDWQFNAEWADKVLTAQKNAEELLKEGKDAPAIDAFANLAAMTMSNDRLKTHYLDQAALCATRLKQYDRALELAKQIPLQPFSIRRQMAIMVDQKKFAELIAAFKAENPLVSWFCPELEDILVDAYTFRSTAYAETGDLKSAEADLMVMINQQKTFGYDNGVEINESAWISLGDFYRKYSKDDAKALEAYSHVTNRTYQPWYATNPVPKPALTGNAETLSYATEAACDILSSQGKPEEVKKLRFSLLKAQAEAFAALRNEQEALSRFKELLPLSERNSSSTEAVVNRIASSDKPLRDKLVNEIAGLATGLTREVRDVLVKASSAPETETGKTALRTLIIFAPQEKVDELLVTAK